MPTQQMVWTGNPTLTAAATARSVLDLASDTSLNTPALSPNATGPTVSLYMSFDKAVRIGGTAAGADDTHGLLLAANIPFAEQGEGFGSNSIPLSQIFVFAPTAGGTVTASMYIRSV
jgi:hypothetical protein